MGKIRLTRRSVEAIKPAARDVVVWDADIPGFGVKVTPRKVKMTPQGEKVTGGARVYILQYSRRNKDRRITIGRHGDDGFTAEQARGKAESLRGSSATAATRPPTGIASGQSRRCASWPSSTWPSTPSRRKSRSRPMAIGG